jgi:hypothetical protein
MPEEQVYARMDVPDYMQAAEAMDLRGPRGEIGDQGFDTAELHVDGNTIGHFTVNGGDIGIDIGSMWREAVAVSRRVKFYLREKGVTREVYLSPDSVYDVDFHGDGVLLVGGEDDVVELTNRGFTDDKYRQLLKKVGELTNSSDPIERAVALKVVGLMCEVGL